MKPKKIIPILSWSFAALPYIALLLFIVFASSMRFALGHWPVVHLDETPESLEPLAVLALILAIGAFWSMPVGVLASLLIFARRTREKLWRPLLGYWVGIASSAVLAVLDPKGFLTWVLD